MSSVDKKSKWKSDRVQQLLVSDFSIWQVVYYKKSDCVRQLQSDKKLVVT